MVCSIAYYECFDGLRYIYNGGKYNNFGIHGTGIATAADSLVAINLDLYDYFTDNYSGVSIPTIEESLYNHMLVFATEQARKSNTIVNVQKFIETF